MPEKTTYYIDALMPISQIDRQPEGADAQTLDSLGMYLLDLMQMQDFTPVSGVRFQVVEPEGPVAYPKGWTVLRALVDVQEFDVDVELLTGD